MVRPLLIFIGGLLITVIQCPAYGETYSWVDSSGTTNFTDNAGSIPKKYRHKAMVGDSIEADPQQLTIAAKPEIIGNKPESFKPSAAISAIEKEASEKKLNKETRLSLDKQRLESLELELASAKKQWEYRQLVSNQSPAITRDDQLRALRESRSDRLEIKRMEDRIEEIKRKISESQ